MIETTQSQVRYWRVHHDPCKDLRCTLLLERYRMSYLLEQQFNDWPVDVEPRNVAFSMHGGKIKVLKYA